MVCKEGNLATWISLALKKTLTRNNIKAGFRGIGIWPLNFEAMKSKMGPSERFLPRNAAEVAQEEQKVTQIMEEGLPPPPSNPTHFHVHNKDENDLVEKVSQEKPPSHHNLSTFLRLPQEVDTRNRITCEPLVDYTQSQILTSDVHVETLFKGKKKLHLKKRGKGYKKNLLRKQRRLKDRKKKIQKKRAHDKEARRLANTAEAIATQRSSKNNSKLNAQQRHVNKLDKDYMMLSKKEEGVIIQTYT